MNINDPLPGRSLAIPFTKAAKTKHTIEHEELRLPLVHRVPDVYRNHFVAMCGEFVGTVLFLFFALSGTQVANSVKSSAGLTVQETGSNPAQLQYIALAFGMSLAVNAWVFFRISGGLFNPAVTVGMCLIGALPWIRGILLFIVQILGGITAAAIVSCLFPGPLLCTTSLGGGTSVAQGVFIEMFLTAELVFTIFMLAAEKHKGTFIAPIGIGLSLFVAELTGVYFTGGSLNPARSFGPAVVLHHFHGYHYIYWCGPILGAVVASGFYKLIKALEYEQANPGQDASMEMAVQKRKDLLVAAGINEIDAEHVAHEITTQIVANAGAGGAMAPTSAAAAGNDMEQGGAGMYGTRFAANGAGSAGPDGAVSPAYTTASRPGDHRYLARRGSYQPQGSQRLESPTMATNEEIYSHLAQDGNQTLGNIVDEKKV